MTARHQRTLSDTPLRKRRKTSAIEEITFDHAAREDFITGFHKRKLQRARYAREVALRKEREEKIAARKALRNERKAELEKHLEAVNADFLENEVSSEKEVDSDADGVKAEGIVVADALDGNHEEQYVDDDQHTTVIVEAVNVTRDGMYRSVEEFDQKNQDARLPIRTETSPDKDHGNTSLQKLGVSKKSSTRKKRKKRNFRYESKTERALTRRKEKSSNHAKAKARKRQL